MVVLNREAKVCLAAGLGTVALLTLSVPQTLFGRVPQSWSSGLIGPVLYYVLLNMIFKLTLRKKDFEVS